MSELIKGSSMQNGQPALPPAAALRESYPASSVEYPDDMTSTGLLDYWQMVMKRKLLIFSLGMAGAVLGFLITIPKPFTFKSKTTLDIQFMNENILGLGQIDPSAPNYSPTEINVGTELKILENSSLKYRVLQRLGRELTPSALPQFTDTLGRVRKKAQDLLGENPQDPLAALRRALQMAAMTLDVTGVKGTRLIEISCESTSPEVAAAFANAIANEYIEQTLESRLKGLQQSTQWFSTQMAELKDKVEKSEARLRAGGQSPNSVAGQTPAAPPQDPLVMAKMVSLQQELTGLQTARLQKQAQYQMAQSDDGVFSAGLATPNLTLLQSRLALLLKQRTDLLKTLQPAHPKVQQMEAEIASTQQDMAGEKAGILRRLRSDLEDIKNREQMATDAYRAQSRSLVTTSGRSLDLSMLQREVDINRQLYQTMLQQLQGASVMAAVPNNNVHIVDVAVPNKVPSNQNQQLYASLGMATGIIIGFVVVVVRHNTDTSFRQPGHSQGLLNARELAVIPSHGAINRRPRFVPRMFHFNAPELDSEGTPISVEMISTTPSLLTESFRAALASILIPPKNGAGTPHVMVITSPNLKEGKSTISSNLAIALAGTNRRVLLMDADLRGPRLTSLFKIQNGPNLVSIIQDSKPVQDYSAEELGASTAIPNLFLLSGGQVPPLNISSLLYSGRMTLLIERLRQQFDMVIIDTPPLQQFSDARVLGRHADGVILVLRSGSTDRESAVAAHQRLTEDGTVILGTILNDWTPPEKHVYPYYQYRV